MKILKLKIKSPIGEKIQDIKFNEAGLFIVLADTKKREEQRETINSLGKTLLLKMIDYLYGANHDPVYFKEEIKGYVIQGKLKKNDEIYDCERVIGSPEKNLINKKSYTLTEYRQFFSINRNLLDKQIFLEEKKSLISPRQYADLNDYLSILTLLDLEKIGLVAEKAYHAQDLIKEQKKNRKHLLNLQNLKLRELEEEVYLVDKQVSEYEEKLNKITRKIENIEITDLQEDILEEYTIKNSEFKSIKRDMELLKIEKERIKKFIKEAENSNVTSEDVLEIYEQAQIELPSMVKQEIGKVQEFHEKVYLERKEYLNKQIRKIDADYRELENVVEELVKIINDLGEMISENEAYKEAISFYEKFTIELNEIKFMQGKLFQLKEIQEEIEKEESGLNDKFEDTKEVVEKYKDKLDKYTDFIYEFVNHIYTEDVTAFFALTARNRHLTTRPLVLELNLRGDTGEGVGNVRKLLIDYLIFKYNTVLSILIQDSSCYNGIDPRQVVGMIKELDKLAKETNKQAIISLNRYQLDDNEETDIFLKRHAVITLSETEKLLGIDF